MAWLGLAFPRREESKLLAYRSWRKAKCCTIPQRAETPTMRMAAPRRCWAEIEALGQRLAALEAQLAAGAPAKRPRTQAMRRPRPPTQAEANTREPDAAVGSPGGGHWGSARCPRCSPLSAAAQRRRRADDRAEWRCQARRRAAKMRLSSAPALAASKAMPANRLPDILRRARHCRRGHRRRSSCGPKAA